MSDHQSPTFVRSGPELLETGLVHNFLQPESPGPYPTVVLIHGRKGNEEVMWVFRRTIPRNWLIVAPCANLLEPDGGYSWVIQPDTTWSTLADFDPAAEAMKRFLDALPLLYNADPDRMILVGFSQGAATAFSTAMRYPGSVHGIASLVGFMPQPGGRDIAGTLPDLPVFMAVGTEDERLPLALARQSRDLALATGAAVEYHEYETGHKLTAAGMRDLHTWLLAR